MPQEIMEWIPQIDLGIVGEAFVTWPEVLEKIEKGHGFFGYSGRYSPHRKRRARPE